MADSFTDNLGLVLQVTGSNIGTWGSDLNTNDITVTDSILGKTLSVSVASSDVALTQSQRQNLAFKLTGTLTTNITITFPLNFNSATVAVGGFFIFDNQTTGAFTVTVKTVASGSTGVIISQGLRAILYSDGTNINWANDGGSSSAYRMRSVAGDPNGVVTGIAGSTTTPADCVWDRTNLKAWFCTAAPTTWSPALPAAVTTIPTPVSGYLTLTGDANNPVLQNDAVGASIIYYTPTTGSVIGIPNGATFDYRTLTQLTLSLSSVYQAASNIYDIFAFSDSGTVRIGFGPSWFVGGGSVTAGSCSRGTGPTSTQISRFLGSFVNAQSLTVNNGATTYSVSVGCALYIGSVFIDATAGQVTCHRSQGQLRKWGLWKMLNRSLIVLQVSDSTVSWDYASATLRYSNNTQNNRATMFVGYYDEGMDVTFYQTLINGSGGSGMSARIGFNQTSGSPSAVAGGLIGFASSSATIQSQTVARYFNPTSSTMGINLFNQLETGVPSGTSRFLGSTEDNLMLVRWNG